MFFNLFQLDFHNELAFVKVTFLKNGYPISVIDKCFKTFLVRLYLKRPQVLTAEKKTLTHVLPFLVELSLQTRTNFKKSSIEHKVVVKFR